MLNIDEDKEVDEEEFMGETHKLALRGWKSVKTGQLSMKFIALCKTAKRRQPGCRVYREIIRR